LNTTGLHADEVIHIGDSLSSDVKGASSVGIKAIWLNRFNKENSCGVDSITNLLEALDKLE
jgi:FMN phosphatase YigB (HAD superfamily)